VGNSSEIDNLTIRTQDEIQSLYSSFKQMTHDIEGYIDNLMKTTNELSQTRLKANQMDELAHRDALTGVGSKLAYDQEAEKLTKDIAQGGAKFGIVMIDLNNLKTLNDSYGHEKGNEAIKKVCAMICEVFDESSVYRIGGDEFVVIIRGDDCSRVGQMVEQFRAMAGEVSTADGEPWETVNAAIGYALYKGDDTVNDVFRRADYSMYECKKLMKERRPA
jgi:diguanylate cyclase (GGDEF)-like protein